MDALSFARERLARLGTDLGANLRFFTRLPWPGAEFGPPDFERIAWAAPLAGALVGLLGAAALVIAHAVRLPAFIAGTIALAAMILATGALHEDGLADVADGFGGGSTRERKLEILRDSRLGTYGVVALVLSLMLRASAIGATSNMGYGYGAAAMALCGALARLGALAPLALLAPARPDGAGSSAGAGVSFRQLAEAAATCLVITMALGLGFLGLDAALFALVVALGASMGVVSLARRHIGGQTGDVAGAAAAAAEIAAWTALLIGFAPA
jgi:adenosylcobinamide-GDP ribazoletransferase